MVRSARRHRLNQPNCSAGAADVLLVQAYGARGRPAHWEHGPASLRRRVRSKCRCGSGSWQQQTINWMLRASVSTTTWDPGAGEHRHESNPLRSSLSPLVRNALPRGGAGMEEDSTRREG